MEMWWLLGVLVAIAIGAPRYGVDSRWPAPGEPPRLLCGPTLRGDLAWLLRRLVGLTRHP